MELIFATSNENKARELQALLPDGIKLMTLKDVQMFEEIPETSETLEGNAILKADYVTKHAGLNCFADDTGLEVFELNMAPGVRSARYAGEHRSDNDNINLLLKNLKGSTSREAQFRTVIALNLNSNQYLFEGKVNGEIIDDKLGSNGFGYDPIFEPEKCGKTFAQMTLEEKNQFSHRARAFQKMISFLEETV